MDASSFRQLPYAKFDGRAWLPVLLIVALGTVLRLLFILVIDPNQIFGGGDIGWYLSYGLKLVTNTAPPVPSGPVYLVYTGFIQLLIPSAAANAMVATTIIRLLNVVWASGLVLAVYALGKRYFGVPVGRLAALVVAINPIFIVESNIPATESVFLTVLFGTFAIYAAYQDKPTPRGMALTGFLLGVAALTRAAVILFPFVLVVHLLRLHGWRRVWRCAVVLVLAYSLTVSTWTIYSLLRWNQFIVGAQGALAFLWMGSSGQPLSPTAADSQLGGNAAQTDTRNEAFLQQFLQKLQHELPAYIKTRVTNLAAAYLQPHNTPYFPGVSLKEAAARWWQTDRSLDGLLTLTQKDAFWPKLSLYLFHFAALLLGVAGMILNWRRFWPRLPLVGYFLYTTAVHSVLLALPRYLFPVQPVFILFGSWTIVFCVLQIRQRPMNRRGIPSMNDSGQRVPAETP